MSPAPDTLAARGAALLAALVPVLAPHRDAARLRARVEYALAQLAAPMRVALVGAIKAGKSTLLNALLGEAVVPTGREVLTYNVNRFLHADGAPFVEAVFKNGARERFPLARLAEFVTRCEASRATADALWYVDVHYPHPLLERFQIIDTPGLKSCVEVDSTRTREFLVHPERRPHAVVFLFEQSFSAAVLDEVDRFHQACGSLMSGVTALACLSKADCLTNGFADAAAVIGQDARQFPRLRRAFYAIRPIAAQQHLAGQNLGDDDFRLLRELSALTGGAYGAVLGDAGSFCAEEFAEVPRLAPPAARAALYRRLGWPVVPTACGLLRAAPHLDRTGLARRLRDGSGVRALLDLLEQHFGARAALLKLKSAFELIREEAHPFLHSADPGLRTAVGAAVERIDEFVAREQAFREHRVLEDFYADRLALDARQEDDLLRVTGERGPAAHERLGTEPGAGRAELLTLAENRHSYWRATSNAIAAPRTTRDAARVLADSYADLAARLRADDQHTPERP